MDGEVVAARQDAVQQTERAEHMVHASVSNGPMTHVPQRAGAELLSVWRYAAPFCIKSLLQHTCACISPQA